jgi:hypothetical protein
MYDIGRHVIEENENVYYNNDRRVYVRCTVKPDQWVATSMEVRGLNPGTTDLTETVGRLDDEDVVTLAKEIN